MIDIEIDGKTFQVEPGSMIIEVADKVGIPIPRFCYHKKLSIAANCRMCLVDVEKAPKPLPACATPVTAGMKISTTSAKAKEAQRSVMEFLLINHPLDCPICDQGGECELQDVSMGYGSGISRFTEGKRSIKDDNLGPLIATEMTRCIQCTRCVRFGQEVAGIRELGATGRGENMQITTYVKHSMTSELSGNIIDLCPVGALTSKPFRFKARAWELQQTESVAPHDCVGSNIYIHTSRDKVMRVVPHENEKINEMWLSDRDRFSYLGVQGDDRLRLPMIKVAGEWQETDWLSALQAAAAGLNKVKHQYGAEQVAALASPSATTEELYLLQKLLRGFGSNNIDHRLQQTDVSNQEFMPLFPQMSVTLEELEAQELIILVGSNIAREQPIVAHRIRKATLRGAQVVGINVTDYAVNFPQQQVLVAGPDHFVQALAGVVKALTEISSVTLPHAAMELLVTVQPRTAERELAALLNQGKQATILLGAISQNHPQAATITALCQLISQLTAAKFCYLTAGANSAGAWLAGAIPHRGVAATPINSPGLSAHQALAAKLKAYILLGIEPELDCTDSALAQSALEQAEFVVALSSFKSPSLLQQADVMLPIAAFSETAGTMINAQGHWQKFSAAVNLPGEARPGWKVLRVLANQLHLAEFAYESIAQVREELEQLLATPAAITEQWFCPPLQIAQEQQGLTRITEWPLYAVDSIVRRSHELQQAASNDRVGAYVNAELAQHLQLSDGMLVNVKQGNATKCLPLIISSQIPKNCVLIHAGREETAGLGAAFGAIEIYAC